MCVLPQSSCCSTQHTSQEHGVKHEAVTVGDLEGVTPLYIAAGRGHLPVLQYLMEVVASLSLRRNFVCDTTCKCPSMAVAAAQLPRHRSMA